MSFVEKAIVDVQSGYVKYDVGGFFDGSIANNDVSADLKVQLKLGSRVISVVVKSGFMLQMNDILLDYITCNGNFSICGVVKFKAQKLPSLFLAATGANLVSLVRVGNATLTDRDWSSDFTRLQDIYSQLYSYLGGHRFQNKYVLSGNVTVPAGSTVTWLNVAGLGYFMFHFNHYSSGIPPGYAFHKMLCDDEYDLLVRLPDIYFANFLGCTTVGNYSAGHKAFRVAQWDTVNHVYEVKHFACASKTPFRTSFKAQFNNTSSADATMFATLQYCIFVSSKKTIFKLPQTVDPVFLKRKMASEKMDVSAIVVQLLGYFEDETEHPYRQFLQHLPNTPANKGKPLVVCEVYSSEEVSINEIAQYLKPEKSIYEETI